MKVATILSKEEYQAIKAKLHDSKNGLRGYVELLDWVESKFNKEMNVTRRQICSVFGK